MIRRRDFITMLGGAATAWPLAAHAQQAALPVIGFLYAGSADGAEDFVLAFRQGLADTGYAEGHGVGLEFRWADGQVRRLPDLAADLVRRNVTVIVAGGSTAATRAAIAATSTIPIVFASAGDPVAEGFVASLNRPGANRTGVVSLTADLVPKRLELLHEVVPAARTVSVLLNPNEGDAQRPSDELLSAARALGLQLEVLRASTEDEVDAVLASLGRAPSRALMIPPNAFFLDRRAQLGALTLRYAIPAIHTYREFAAAGGLMAYGGSRSEQAHHLGVYAGRILKGEKAADLPVQQATKIELTINLKAAKALGLTVPPSLLATADEVIE